MQDDGIPPAPVEVTGEAIAQPEAEAAAPEKGPEADLPVTTAATPGTATEDAKPPPEKKKRKRSVNPAHFRNKKKTKRNFWTQEEVDALLKGVEKIGPGKWTKIKGEFPKIFEQRTSLDLKDKWRNIERRPDTNKIAKVSRAKKAAAGETESKSYSNSDGLEPLILTVDCEDGENETEKTADNVTAASSKTNDLYVWAISKFYPSLGKDDVESISLLSPDGNLIPYNKTLKEANLINNARLRVYKKTHEAFRKEQNVQDV